MATVRDGRERVAIAIMARAPMPGLAKTRLIPLLGAHGAAALQQALTARAAATAVASGIGPVTLWAAPDATHPSFRELAIVHAIGIRRQPEGDLGARMLAACIAAAGPVLVIGSDCPALTAAHLHRAAAVLRGGLDAVVIPAEDGGYVLIGMRVAQPVLFSDMTWGHAGVMQATRERAHLHALALQELEPLWDVDRPDDVERLRADADFAAFF